MATVFEQAIEAIRETDPAKADLLEALHRAEVAEQRAAEAEAARGFDKNNIDWEKLVEAKRKRDQELKDLGGKAI